MKTTRTMRVLMFRHGQTEYTERYPDITSEGKRSVHAAAGSISRAIIGRGIVAHCSRAVRARGTLDHLITSARLKNVVAMEKSGVSAVEIFNRPKAERFFGRLKREIKLPYAAERAYIAREGLYRDSEVIEQKQSVDMRVFAWAQSVVREFVETDELFPGVSGTLLVSTHFEVIHPLVCLFFGQGVASDPVRHVEHLILDVGGQTDGTGEAVVRAWYRGTESTKKVSYRHHR